MARWKRGSQMQGASVVNPGLQNNPQLLGQSGEQVTGAIPNDVARRMVLDKAIAMVQSIQVQTFNPANGNNVSTFIPRNVGLIKGFYVTVAASITNSDGANTLTLTPFGLANLFSQIQFTDLANNQRINTSGWHINLLNTVKGHRVYGSAFTTDNPMASGGGYGSNFARIISAPATIAHGVSTTVYMMYYIPLAYTWSDLRGAIYANTINATMQLQCVVNPQAIGAAGTDPTLAVYTGAAGSITSVTINYYQDYYDQLPVDPRTGGVILPYDDLSTIYEIKNTTLTGVVVNQDFPIPYTNFRNFLSTAIVYDNGGTLNAGTDVSYLSLQSANFTNLFKVDPYLMSLWTRQLINDDMPKGVYYSDTRRKPLSTVQYGNLQMNLNASTVNAGAVVYAGFESFGKLNQITGAGSLPSS